jgi:GNAT superfamily N-acetyltransferase
MNVEFHPLTPERWTDFEKLFGKNGAYGGCWCMWWRITRSQFEKQHGEGNRQAMKELVWSDEVPGILAYVEGEAVGWCSLGPREKFGSLNRSPVLKRLDERPVWSIVCFYVAKSFRNQGLMKELIQGAIEYVKEKGGEIVEAYPTQPKAGQLLPVSSYMGISDVFEEAGFVECKRPSSSKVIMRYYIHADQRRGI